MSEEERAGLDPDSLWTRKGVCMTCRLWDRTGSRCPASGSRWMLDGWKVENCWDGKPAHVKDWDEHAADG
jgi:hypothetical protein